MSLESLKAESIGWWECQSGGASNAPIEDLSSNGNDAYLDGIYTVSTTTGPTAFLPLALNLTTALNWVRVTNAAPSFVSGAAARTYGGWGNAQQESEKAFMLVGAEIGYAAEGRCFRVSVDPAAGFIAIDFNGHIVRGSIAIAISEWHHYAIVVPDSASSTADIKAYLDGEEVTLTTYSGSAKTLDTTFTPYQGFAGAGTAKWEGLACGFTSFDRALSAEEIMTLVTGADAGGAAGRRRPRLGLGGNLGLRMR